MSAQEEKPRLSPVWNSLKIVLALVLAGFVVSKTDFKELFSLRERIVPAWLVAVFLLFIFLTILKALQYYFLIGRRVDYDQVLHVVIIQNSVSNFIATGAGIASYFTLFRVEHGVKISRAALAFILAKIGDFISIWLILFITSIFVWHQIGMYHLVVEIILIVVGMAIFAFFTAIFLRHKFISALRTVLSGLKLIRIGLISKGLDTLQLLAEQEQSFIFRIVGLGTMFSMCYMVVTMAWLYASFRAFSLQIELMLTVFVNTLIQLISYLPIQVFGGLGVNETTMLYLYDSFHIPQAELAAVLIATRLLFYVTNLLVLLYLPLHTLVLNRSIKKNN